MIHIDINLEISNCFYCTSQNKQICDCNVLYVNVAEKSVYKRKNIALLKTKKWLLDYEKTKIKLIDKIKKNYPKAKKYKIYPFTEQALPLLQD